MISLGEANAFCDHGDSADLFIEDKSALEEMSCIDTQPHTHTHSCTGSNL